MLGYGSSFGANGGQRRDMWPFPSARGFSGLGCAGGGCGCGGRCGCGGGCAGKPLAGCGCEGGKTLGALGSYCKWKDPPKLSGATRVLCSYGRPVPAAGGDFSAPGLIAPPGMSASGASSSASSRASSRVKWGVTFVGILLAGVGAGLVYAQARRG